MASLWAGDMSLKTYSPDTQCRSVLTYIISVKTQAMSSSFTLREKKQLKYLSELKLGGINIELYKCNSTGEIPLCEREIIEFISNQDFNKVKEEPITVRLCCCVTSHLNEEGFSCYGNLLSFELSLLLLLLHSNLAKSHIKQLI